MNDHVDPEEMLRRGMTARAHDTDPSPDLAVRIVASTEAHPATRIARRRGWDLVLGAAAAAAALLVGIAVGVRTFHTSRTGEATTTAPTLTQSVVPTPTPTATVEPRGFSATDLTWISENEGWAQEVVTVAGKSWTAGRWRVPLVSLLVLVLLVLAGAAAIHLTHKKTSSARGTTPAQAVPTATPTRTELALPVLSSDSVQGSPASSVGTPTSGGSQSMPPGAKVTDLSWVGNEVGFALTQPSDCKVLPGQSCFLLARTSDGGATWHLVTKSEAEIVPGTASHVRFANSKIGYIWGDHLYRSDDGGVTWVQQPESDYAQTYGEPTEYEASDGNVLRLTYGAGQFFLEAAKVGTNDWTPVFGSNGGAGVPLPPKVEAGRLGGGQGASYFQELYRVGSRAVILEHRNPAGGGTYEYSELFVSSDNGAHWRNFGEPCPQTGSREVDSTSLSMGDDGSIVVLCRPRTTDPAPFVAISTDGGLSFKAAPPSLGAGTRTITAASATTILAWSDALYRSTDAGRTWQRVLEDPAIGSVTGDVQRPLFLGFESASVGRYVTLDGVTIYTTRDGGATWASSTLS